MVRLLFWIAACACGAFAPGCGDSPPAQGAPVAAGAGALSAAAGTFAQRGGFGAAGSSGAGGDDATLPGTGAAGSSGTGGGNAALSGTGAAGSSGVGGSDAAAPETQRMPCDVASVFQRQCDSCHGATLNLGAPMHLVTWSDLQTPGISDPSKTVHELVAARVQDTMRPMPPRMNGKLAVADRALLVDWSAQGAPALPGSAPDCP
jgi:hypothetical protein